MTMNLTAVVMGGEDWREHDRRLLFYTHERGKLTALARGVRKIESKLAAHLEPFTTTEVFFVEGYRGLIVAGSVVEEPRLTLRSDLDRLTTAGRIVYITDAMTPLESRDERIFDILDSTLTLIDKSELRPHGQNLLIHLYAWKLLSLSGYHPELKRCLVCRKVSLSPITYMHPRRGGIVHEHCLTPQSQEGMKTLSIHHEALKGLAYMLNAPLSDISRLVGSSLAFEEMCEAVELIVEERFDIAAHSTYWQTALIAS